MQEDMWVRDSLQKALCVFCPEMNKIKSKHFGDNKTQRSFHVTTYIRRLYATFYSNRKVLALSLRLETTILS
jgi:hypothetical protein